jgi:nucleoside-diphosphate-sugar epimerase
MRTAAGLTGVTGFLGSHFALQFLRDFPNEVLLCFARGKGGLDARRRVLDALRTAHDNSGFAGRADRYFDRVVVAEDNLLSGDGSAAMPAWDSIPFQITSFWHSAASVNFVESQRSVVWQTNVDGLRNALSLARRMNVSVFNHVSTAYVCGNAKGRILETDNRMPAGFNNIYEESKHYGEQMVREFCRNFGMSYRILRPSIIIGHSQTFNTSSSSGFYYCLDVLRQLHEKVSSRDPEYFQYQPFRVRMERNATLNLIPVDIVVSEMLDLHRAGYRTVDQTFHLTNECPASALDLLQMISHDLGIMQIESAGSDGELRPLDRLFNRQLEVFTPYLTQNKLFDRSNVARHGIDRHQMSYLLDMQRLKKFIAGYQPGNVAATDNHGSYAADGMDDSVDVREVVEAV